MNLLELLRRAEIDAELPQAGELEVRGVTFDSRDVDDGWLFVALRGERFDGHDYVARAAAAGAVAALVEEDRSELPSVVVPDTRAALPAIAAAFHERPSDAMKVCGITGTNGKTTCSFIIEAIVGRSMPVGVLGTVNYRWPGATLDAPNTTPESLVTQRLLARMRDDGVEAVVMEVSSHGLATHRVEGTHFDVMLFTNFTQDHLDFHESMDAYFAAKARLFDHHVRAALAAGKRPTAVINVDSGDGETIAELARDAGASVVTYGTSTSATVRYEARVETLSGTSFVTIEGGSETTFRTGLLGRFNVANAVGSMLAARALGASEDDVRDGLSRLDGVPGRLQRVGGRFFVDYAHTPDAIETVLQTLRPCLPDNGRLIVLMGAGGDRDRSKRPQMGRAAAKHADVVVVTNDNPRSEPPRSIAVQIVAGIDLEPVDSLSRGRGFLVELDRRRAIELAVTQTGPDDVVIVAGKGHETYQEVGGVRLDFDDVAVLKAALEGA